MIIDRRCKEYAHTYTYNTHTHIHGRRWSTPVEYSRAFTRAYVCALGSGRIVTPRSARCMYVCTLRNALYAPRKRCRRKRATAICIPRGSDDHCNATRTIRSSVCVHTPLDASTWNSGRHGKKVVRKATREKKLLISLESPEFAFITKDFSQKCPLKIKKDMKGASALNEIIIHVIYFVSRYSVF